MAEPAGVEITGPISARFDEVLTSDAIEFLGALHREFDSRRRDLLGARATRYEEIANGGTLDFLAETKAVRHDQSWKVADPAPGLRDRRAEITGPSDAKMAINALRRRLGRGPVAVHRDGDLRRVRRLLHPPGLRTHALSS